ncbi:ATP-binding protein [Pandoraea sp.]|uniref:ATP-binding protein n=1 Tax=Pandoraea sp. TaxID=1883445 RepID=UPI0012091A4B|nr:ATP-binding protein [Pandoraea sp.]TAL53593.1 MAG: response regulator [Pandoraea sp.]TAM14864.1 MAG: response regulator [Pandoraea sp.]
MPLTPAAGARASRTSYRFLIARTALIIALFATLLAIYIVLLVAYTVWDRSEQGALHFAQVQEEISRQEYFVRQFNTLVPHYFCRAGDQVCRSAPAGHWDRPLPPIGAPAEFTLPGNEPFYVLRTHSGESATTADILLRLGLRFVEFDTAFWGAVVSDERSLFLAADGSTAIFIPHRLDHGLGDAAAMSEFVRSRLAAFQRAMARSAGVRERGAAVYWVGPEHDLISGKSVLICFIPIYDPQGNLVAYASTDVAPDVIDARAQAQRRAFKGDLFLVSENGKLILLNGRRPPAAVANELRSSGRRAALSLQFKPGLAVVQISRRVPHLDWHLVYAVSLASVIGEKIVPIGIAIALFLLATGAAILSARHLIKTVLIPQARQARQLVDSENFNRTVIETSPIGLAVLRKHDRSVAMQNRNFIPLSRWRPVAAPGGDTTPRGALPDPGWAAALVFHQQLGRHPHISDTQTGRIYQLELADTTHKDDAVVLCALADITEQKQAEQILEHARREAEAASAAKTQFLATISHEIRTPLYGMLASIELLIKTRLDSAQQQLTLAMDSSARTLKDVLNDALDFTKAGAGDITLDDVVFDLVTEAEQVVQGFWSRANLKGIDLRCFMDPAMRGRWQGDALKIRQILNNLLNNAIKFTERGHATLRGRLLAQDGTRVRVMLEVEDSGPGIAKSDLERIFVPFGQVGSHAGRTHFSGTGLGLSICRSFIAAMNGDIHVASQPGQGSAFRVTLPLTRVAPPPASEAALLSGRLIEIDGPDEERVHLADLIGAWGGSVRQAPGASAAADEARIRLTVHAGPDVETPLSGSIALGSVFSFQPHWQGNVLQVTALSQQALFDALAMVCRSAPEQCELPSASNVAAGDTALGGTVLVADDQVINRMLLERQLAQLGCSVIAAGDGCKALALAKSARYDIVLTDLNMPGMSGYTLSQELRAAGVTVPIVAITAGGVSGEREKCLQAGMDDCLQKPFDIETLHAALMRHLPGAAAQVSIDPPRAADGVGPDSTTGMASATEPMPHWTPDMTERAAQSLQHDADALQGALEQEDTAKLREVAHRAQGGLAALEIKPAVLLCQSIEQCIEYEWGDEAFALASTLQAILVQTAQDMLDTE